MIENVQTGEWVVPAILPVGTEDLEAIGSEWRFDWPKAKKSSEIYRLVDPARPGIILGLISLRRFEGQHVEIDLIESHPRHVGSTKIWRGVAGNLLAFAARTSIAIGGEGFVALVAKTDLVAHFQARFGFRRVGRSNRLILDTYAARRLIQAIEGA